MSNNHCEAGVCKLVSIVITSAAAGVLTIGELFKIVRGLKKSGHRLVNRGLSCTHFLSDLSNNELPRYLKASPEGSAIHSETAGTPRATPSSPLPRYASL